MALELFFDAFVNEVFDLAGGAAVIDKDGAVDDETDEGTAGIMEADADGFNFLVKGRSAEESEDHTFNLSKTFWGAHSRFKIIVRKSLTSVDLIIKQESKNIFQMNDALKNV